MAGRAANELVGGKYRLQGLLGEGGLGEVWSARHELLGGDVALKFLKPAESAKPDAVGRFLREARAASALRSDHVCKVFDVGTHAGVPFLVMERLEGEDLGSLLDACGTLTPSLAAHIVVQACEALGEAHRLGIIHRDVKPENLFLVWREGGPFTKVLDFGLATGATQDLQAQRLTATTTTFGTPLYMAPEQLRAAKNADARSDIWSLGVLLFFATAGRHPYTADAVHELCIQIATEEAPPLRSVWPELPEAFAAVVDRCLRKDPAARFATVDALAEALRPFAAPAPRPAPLPERQHAPDAKTIRSGHERGADKGANPFGGTMAPVSATPGRAPAPTGRTPVLLAVAAAASLIIAGSLGAIAYRLAQTPPGGAPTAAASGPASALPAASAPATTPPSAGTSPPALALPSATPQTSAARPPTQPFVAVPGAGTGKPKAAGSATEPKKEPESGSSGAPAVGANGALILH